MIFDLLWRGLMLGFAHRGINVRIYKCHVYKRAQHVARIQSASAGFVRIARTFASVRVKSGNPEFYGFDENKLTISLKAFNLSINVESIIVTN